MPILLRPSISGSDHLRPAHISQSRHALAMNTPEECHCTLPSIPPRMLLQVRLQLWSRAVRQEEVFPMKTHLLLGRTLTSIGLLVICFVTITGCGTRVLKHYPDGLSHQDAMKQRYECEREAQQAIPAPLVPDRDDWRPVHVARMRNLCLAAKGWTE